jgi:hypothetical protein
MTGGEAVWDVSIFRYLLQRYPSFEVSRAGQEMMVQAASMTSIRSLVETHKISGYVDVCLSRVLVEGGG